jgi:hypothetical protein
VIADALRAALAIVAGFVFWRLIARTSWQRDVLWIVGLGLALRGILGAALFWISYLGLPVFPSLQLGGGFWFIAWDGIEYVKFADRAAGSGPIGILTLNPTLPSVLYTKVLAMAMFVVGRVPSTALLINAVAYVALCVAMVRLAERTRAPRPVLLLTLGAVSFMPSWLLWSVQPLKDPLFISLIGLYSILLVVWIDHLRRADRRLARTQAVAVFGSLWVLLYAVAGIRWYYASLLFAATLAVWIAASVAGRVPVRRFAAGLALAVLLSQAVPLGAGPFLPGWIQPFFRPSLDTADRIPEAPGRAVEVMDRFRAGIAATGETEIRIPLSAANPRSPSAAAVRPAADPPGDSRQPSSAFEKLLVGSVAMLVPHQIATTMGWIEIGGGRNLWLFADLDTVVFDAVIMAAAVLVLVGLRRGQTPHPVFWQVLLVTALIAGALAYDGGNFGTLFRHRGMVGCGVILLPLLLQPRAPAADPRR